VQNLYIKRPFFLLIQPLFVMPFPVSVTAGWAARANINTTGSDVTGYFRYPEYPDMSLPACQWMGW
jgi:hypothetical protein